MDSFRDRILLTFTIYPLPFILLSVVSKNFPFTLLIFD